MRLTKKNTMAVVSSLLFLIGLFSLSFPRHQKNWLKDIATQFPILMGVLAMLFLFISGCFIVTLPVYSQVTETFFVAARVKPNPAADIIELVVDTSFVNQKFKIVSEDGNVHHQDIITDERTQVPIQFLKTGIYYVYLDKATLPIRFIKQ